MDFCRKASGFADLENTADQGWRLYVRPAFFRPAAVDLGSAVNFDVDTRLCLFYVQILDPKPVNEI